MIIILLIHIKLIMNKKNKISLLIHYGKKKDNLILKNNGLLKNILCLEYRQMYAMLQ
jgi:hypothetical protein